MRAIFLAGLIALPMLYGIAARADEPVKIRVGWSSANASIIPTGLEKKELMLHYGKSYTVEPVRFGGSPAVITGLGTGDVDFGQLAYSAFAFAIENAKMTDLRIIADVFQDGVAGHYTGKYDVLQTSPIKTVEDLKGKVLAASAAGSAMDIGLRSMLRKHHLDDRKDVTIIEAQFPSMPAMLTEKKADLISATVPFSEDPALAKVARTLFTQKDAVGETQMIVWVAHESFLTKNRAAAIDFLEDSLRVLAYFQDPKNHEEVAAILARFMKQSPEQFGWMFTDGDFYRAPNGRPNLKVMQGNIDQLHQLGIIPAPLDVAHYADLSYVDAAAARLSANRK